MLPFFITRQTRREEVTVSQGLQGRAYYATSLAGVNWTARISRTTKYLRAITAISTAGTRLVAVGDRGTVIISDDSGKNWASRTSGTEGDLLGIVAIGTDRGNKLVAVGREETVITSTDNGDTWDFETSMTTQLALNAITAINTESGSRLVAVGENGIVRTSDDSGKSWTAQISGTAGHLWGVTAIGTDRGSRLVAVGAGGQVVISDDNGESWAARISGTGGLHLISITAIGSRLVAVGDGDTAITSIDSGESWKVLTSGTGKLTNITAIDSRLVAVGLNGRVITSGNRGELWTVQASGTSSHLISITAIGIESGSRLVAVGENGTVITSDTKIDCFTTPSMTRQTRQYGTTRLTGLQGPPGPPGPACYITELAGINWTARVSGGAYIFRAITTITTGGIARLVAVGDMGIVTTSDDKGVTWETQTSGLKTTEHIYGATAIGSTVFAVGFNTNSSPSAAIVDTLATGIVITSDDGVRWAKLTPTTTNYQRGYLIGITAITTGSGINRLVAVGGLDKAGIVIISDDKGVTWRDAASVSGKPQLLHGIAVIGSMLVAVGHRGTVMTSGDYGVTWQSRPSGTSNNLISITAIGTESGSRLVAVGRGGVVITSDTKIICFNTPSMTRQIRQDGATRLTGLQGPPGPQGPACYITELAGIYWTARASGVGHTIRAITTITTGGITRLVAGGGMGIVTTSDDKGVTWKTQTSGLKTTEHIWGATAIGSTVFAVGFNTNSSPSAALVDTLATGIVITSDDGIRWAKLTPTTTNYQRGYLIAITAITTGSGITRLVAVGGLDKAGIVIISDDKGVTWKDATSVSGKPQLLRGIAVIGSMLVAVGNDDAVMTSGDYGVTWQSRPSGTGNHLISITAITTASGITRLVAVGNDGAVITSDDYGFTWDSRLSGTSNHLIHITAIGSRLVAVGRGGTVITSSDYGENWRAQASRTGSHLQDITAIGTESGSRLVAVGRSGVVITSDTKIIRQPSS